MALGKSITTVRKTRKGIKNIFVDVSQRVERSFGRPIDQMIEIEFNGQPFKFFYKERIEEVTIDVVKRELNQRKNQKPTDNPENLIDISGENNEGLQVVLNKRFSNEMMVTVKCLDCDFVFDPIKMVSHADLEEINNIEFLKKHGLQAFTGHVLKGHKLAVVDSKFETVDVPETSRIKKEDFEPKKIRFYKLFAKNKVEVDFLCSYDQDLIAEAPHTRFTETHGGGKEVNQTLMAMMGFGWIVTAIVLVAGILSLMTYSPYTYSVNPHTSSNSNTGWILFGSISAMICIMFLDRLHIKSKVFVKTPLVTPTSFHISNRGIIPVYLSNSVYTNPMDYLSRMLHVGASEARAVFDSLNRTSFDLLQKTHSALHNERMHNRLNEIVITHKDIQNNEMSMKTSAPSGFSLLFMLIACGITGSMVFLIMLFLVVL
jgi:hypothetical protein